MAQPLAKRISLSWLLVVPFVVQLLGTVGVVGYLSWRNGQNAVEELAIRLIQEVCDRTQLKLKQYFAQPHLINQINANALESGQVPLANLAAVETLLFRRLQEFNDISGVLVGTAQGELRAINRRGQLRLLKTDPHQRQTILDYALTPEGQPLKLLQSFHKPDVREMPWYQAALTSEMSVWSPVFQTSDHRDLSLNANRRIYDQQTGKLMGVVSSGIVLSVIDDFLDELQVSPNGVVFVMERNGLLLGTSSEEPIYERLTVNRQVVLQRISARESPCEEVSTVANFLAEKLPSPAMLSVRKTFEFSPKQGMPLFVEVAPFADGYGLDLLIVVVIPKQDFMAQIQANTRNTIWLCGGATVVAIALGLWTARGIARPISQLSQASRRIAAGDFSQLLPRARIREVDVMVAAFNQMRQQLQTYATDLEAQVKTRTAELEQEICDRKRIEHQLEQARALAESANRAKSEFLANMSHELRTPLNAILGFTQLMSYQTLTHPDQREYLTIINHSGEQLLSLINNVLDMAKIEANQIELVFSSVDLPQLLKKLEDLFSLKAREKQLTLTTHFDPRLPLSLYTDESKLWQILVNLVSNAIKFTEIGHIKISIQRVTQNHEVLSSQDFLAFQVEDTGPGIAPSDIDRIFAPFGQTRYGQQMSEGTGLGLAITQRYAQLLGGQLRVESTLEKGSCFILHLPLRVETLPQLSPPQSHRPLPLQLPSDTAHRLLIAEDEPENRYLLEQCLKFPNLEVRYVENGLDCLQLWQSWSPHVILMDLDMPLLDGYEATRRIKASADGQKTIIIVISSHAFEENRRQAIAAGCDDFICKPIQLQELLLKLVQYLKLDNSQLENTLPLITGYPLVPTEITALDLQVMSLDWIRQLQSVAYQCNDQQVMGLLIQIPTTHAVLISTLQALAKAYRFGEIAKLAELALAQSFNDSQVS